ncbi:MAG: hypothetical protein HRU26_04050 [Psychroserpens sp.]|nr:hypothetical protein [Psychroserpens sp.]
MDNDKIKNVEDNWNEFKNVLKNLETWVRMKDKDLGQKQYSFINQMIKTSEEINISQMIKRTAWKKYKKCKGTDREQQNWKYFKWTRNRTKKLLKKTGRPQESSR